MRQKQPYNEIKNEAKQILIQNLRTCTMITLAAGMFYLAVLIIQSYYAVGFILQFSDSAVDSAASALSIGAGGFSVILRLEDIGVVAKISATLPQLIAIAVMQLFSIILTAPAIFGARALLCRLSDGEKIEPSDLKGIFRWYTDLALAGRAILLYGLVTILQWVFQLLSAGIILYYLFSKSVSGSAAGTQPLFFVVFLFCVAILLFGLMLTWSLLPAGWLQSREPRLSPIEALRRGRQLLRGWVVDHFVFRLSFFVWFVLTLLSYNALMIFLFPYYQIAEACYLKRLSPEAAQKLPPRV
jgi:uncharacterized membrane protein